MKKLTKYFINGMIVLLPITITWLIINKIFTVAEETFWFFTSVHFPGIGLFITLLIIFFVGWLSSYWLMKCILEFCERILEYVPIVKFIYKNIKKLSTVVLDSGQFLQRAVLVPYPHPDIKTLGFVVSELSKPLQDKLSEEHVSIFIPMSLNPTAGINIIVPKKNIILLDVTAESALEYILTAGTVMPRYLDSWGEN